FHRAHVVGAGERAGAEADDGDRENHQHEGSERQRDRDRTRPARTELFRRQLDPSAFRIVGNFRDPAHRHAAKWPNSPPDIRSTSSMANNKNRYKIDKPNICLLAAWPRVSP